MKVLLLFSVLWSAGQSEVRGERSSADISFCLVLVLCALCLHFFSEVNQKQGLFSLATRLHDNTLMLQKETNGSYKIHTGRDTYLSGKLPTNLLDWNSVCWTWDSRTGLNQLWLNRLRSSQKLVGKNHVVTGETSIIIGQEQDKFGGSFNTNDSFEGDITDLHMWDHVVPPCDIRSYMNQGSFSPGNLLNWGNLNYTMSENVVIQDADFTEPICQ